MKNKGFSLLEMMIVIIIIGILASIAGYYIYKNTERARWTEAKTILNALLAGQLRHRIQKFGNTTYCTSSYDYTVKGFRCIEVYFNPSKYFNYFLMDNPNLLACARRTRGSCSHCTICIDQNGIIKEYTGCSPGCNKFFQ
ncbi:MAG: prepilin-type N-terminal cleavage/methylation domain-containing protein [Candidatus Omnitrophica bacterium]|nr:prepilin-type N-terminal cleavage/methylation domain-containing protein [Candidatus Omnitrophota bacterium]